MSLLNKTLYEITFEAIFEDQHLALQCLFAYSVVFTIKCAFGKITSVQN